jgi:hypothetical protein
MYTGDMVQNVQTKVSYKSEKKITLDKSLWIIVDNTHEALIDKDTFKYKEVDTPRNPDGSKGKPTKK